MERFVVVELVPGAAQKLAWQVYGASGECEEEHAYALRWPQRALSALFVEEEFGEQVTYVAHDLRALESRLGLSGGCLDKWRALRKHCLVRDGGGSARATRNTSGLAATATLYRRWLDQRGAAAGGLVDYEEAAEEDTDMEEEDTDDIQHIGAKVREVESRLSRLESSVARAPASVVGGPRYGGPRYADLETEAMSCASHESQSRSILRFLTCVLTAFTMVAVYLGIVLAVVEAAGPLLQYACSQLDCSFFIAPDAVGTAIMPPM